MSAPRPVHRTEKVTYGKGRWWGPVDIYAVVYDEGTVQLCVDVGACSVVTYPSAEECLALARMLEGAARAQQTLQPTMAEA